MAKVIGLVQVKGGSGRSTIATSLAGELARENTVTLIDCDLPQGTAASWAALREQVGLTSATAANYRELLARVERFGHSDYIVVDGPPRIAEMVRAVLLVSDLALVPLNATHAEIWSTQDLLPILTEAGKATKRRTVRIVWTRYRGYLVRAQELSREATKALGLRALESRLGYRSAYAEALGAGQTAAELSDPLARNEVQALVAEVQAILS